MLRALLAATSILKTVESGIRRRPMRVPSRSATAIAILVAELVGKRMAARVFSAVAWALSKTCWTSETVSILPAVGWIKSLMGGCPLLQAAGRSGQILKKLPLAVPGLAPAGRDVLLTRGKAIPPMKTAPGSGSGLGMKLKPAVFAPLTAANSA